jgi:flagellar biosynthesis protein FlhA
MSDVTAGSGPKRAPQFSLGAMVDLFKRGDLALAVGVLAIIVVLLLPMPAWLLDALLAVSIITSVMILMIALFIKEPLEFSSFPTVLLMSTLLRLALNIASTRLILSHGHEGLSAAGSVIEAFAGFVMGGNFIIGVIVFAILVLVNFVVITKGSGRIAEVAARFNLDAMPGKQMAIDADLSAGLIDEKEARRRRKHIEDESSFFGSMDGASKFVKGDAIAGLIITLINIIGGLIIGVAQMGLTFGQAATNYTTLTVGDGLVSQIPALIVSIAAGLLVSKAGISGSADKTLGEQFSNYPKALGMSAAVMFAMMLLPGIPKIPFLAMALGAGFLAWKLGKNKRVAEDAAASLVQEESNVQAGAPAEEPIANALKIDELKVEIGYGLLPMIDAARGEDRLTEQIRALRRQIASDLGFVMPSVRIVDNVQLDSQSYTIRIKEVEAGHGRVFPDQFMVMNPTGGQVDLPGVATTEPTFGLPCTWVDAGLRDEAQFRGYTVVDPATVLSTHLAEVLKANLSDILSYADVQKLLKELPKETQKLIDDMIPSMLSVSGLQRVLQMLLVERVSIRDLGTILEGVAEAVGLSRNPQIIAEAVRVRLGRQICAQNQNQDGVLPLVSLSPKWEQAFIEATIGQGDERHLAMAPSKLHEFIQSVRERFEEAARDGEIPVLLCSPQNRVFVRQIVERFRSQTVVMSQAEIHPRARLKTVGVV